MTFQEILTQVIAWLQRDGRVSYRALKRQFDLDDAYLEDLKIELIHAKKLAVDEDERILVWASATGITSISSPLMPEPSLELPEAHVGPSSQSHAPDAERRQLTVMFSDLVDSTRLSTQLDPEELREVVRAYQAACAEAVQHFGGHIAQYLGDAVLVYFGYPQAHEDDAQRAVRAGLATLEALKTLNSRLERERRGRLAIRIGIHTGLVVVGEMGAGGRYEHLALGETPNVASRIQGMAPPDTVAVSAATHRLIQGYFVCQDLGAHTFKGVVVPVQMYRVLEESGAQSRLEATAARGLTPLVGRDQEVSLLLERWTQAKGGRGQVVALNGEAGIGKSRLVQMLRDRVDSEAATPITYRCSPYHTNSAFYPLIVHLERFLQLHRNDTAETKLNKLEAMLKAYHLLQGETVSLLAALLSLPHPAHYPHLQLSPQKQREKTKEALAAWLLAETDRQPVLAVWEDLHWADPSTLEYLNLLCAQAPTGRLLVLLTWRPEFRPSWESRSPVTEIILDRLEQAQIKAMISSITGGEGLPPRILEQVIAKSDGVPLFVEEFTKTMIETGVLQRTCDHDELTGPASMPLIPTTLQDSLMARLDRLITAKGLAQLGATIGRQFSYDLLQTVAQMDEAVLNRELARLVDAAILYQRGTPPHATYLFKHALLQEAAYQSLLKSTRQQYHQRIVQTLERRFPEAAETQPEVLAHHYTEAGLIEQGVGYWYKAGQRASLRSANLEAIGHLTRGLELLKSRPDTLELAHHELMLLTALGGPLQATRGYAALERKDVYTRAWELCQRVGETVEHFPVLFGLWQCHAMGAEWEAARSVGEQLLSMAWRQDDSGLLLEAHRALGFTLLCLGELAAARALVEHGAALYDPKQHHAHAFLYGQDPGMSCCAYAAWTLWMLGYPDRALARSHEALTIAEDRAHPYSVTWALNEAARIHQYRREVRATHERADRVVAISREQGFAFTLACGTALLGWTLAMQDGEEEGMIQIRQALTAYRAAGLEAFRPYFLGLLAEAEGRARRTEEGLAVVAEALTVVDRTGEQYYASELHRLQGALLLQRSDSDTQEAETCFQRAVALARRQQARSLELRAALSLGRLWRQQGKREEARELLAEVYEWFTEGFDTADLKEAKALLDALREC